jgi:hypothetical protein
VYSQRRTSGYTKKIDAERTAGSQRGNRWTILGRNERNGQIDGLECVFFLHNDIDP